MRYTLLSFNVDAAYCIFNALKNAHVQFEITSNDGALEGWWRFDITVNS